MPLPVHGPINNPVILHAPVPIEIIEVAPPVPPVVEAAKRKRGGTNDLEERATMKKMKTGDLKLDLIIRLNDAAPDDNSQLTEGARFFVPIHSCFLNHFQANKDAFLAKWGNFSQSSFAKKCCNGKGPICNG